MVSGGKRVRDRGRKRASIGVSKIEKHIIARMIAANSSKKAHNECMKWFACRAHTHAAITSKTTQHRNDGNADNRKCTKHDLLKQQIIFHTKTNRVKCENDKTLWPKS